MIEYSYLPPVWWLIGGAAICGLGILASYALCKGRAPRWLKTSLGLLRALTIAAIVLCLLDPERVEPIKRDQNSRVAVLVDGSRSMSIKDLPEQRLAAAQSWVEHEFAPHAPAGFDINYYGFGEKLTRVTTPADLRPNAEATGLADALHDVLSVSSDEPLSAVVVCSDGIDTVGQDPTALARTYRHKGIPIHTLTVGTTNDMQDIVIENVQVRRVVPNEAPTKVTVSLRARGYANRDVPIQIFKDKERLAAQTVRLTGLPQSVELTFSPKQKGFQVFEVRIPPQPGEWLASNNQRLFGIDVIDPTIRVIYMEGTPQQPGSPIPEWKYLKAALESDPHIKVRTLYREFGANGKHLNTVDVDPETGEKIYPVEHPTKGFPQTLSELLDYDVVIHSDIRKESFSAEQLQNIARLVEDYGGGFVMIGGNSAFGKGGYHRTILDRIIPVAMHQNNDSQARPFQLHIPALAWTHPIIAIGATPQQTQLIWTSKFPLLYGCNLVERPKPGAVVLGDDPSLQTGSRSRLIMAVQNIGKGRSMAFTSDTTRTWGKDFETLWGERINPSLPLTERNCDSRYYRQFWVNAVRWLAAARLGRTNNGVTLELAQNYCLPDAPVHAAVKVTTKDSREISSANVSLLTSTNGKTNAPVRANWNPAERAYVAELKVPQTGQYVVTAVASSDTQRRAAAATRLGDDRQLLVCEDTDREMADLRARPEVMARLSQLSGGKVLSLSGAEPTLANSVFYKAPPATVEYRRTPVWAQVWVLAGILGLLSLEWALRRLKGLA